MKNLHLFFIFIPFLSFSQISESKTYVIENETLQIQIDLPEENYKGSRFDWTGKIAAVYYKGIPISTTEQISGEKENELGKGFYNEFGIEMAVGFDEITEGEYFHKIGIGLVKKKGGKYEFYKNYEIKPAEFKVTEGDNELIIECISEEHMGYAYYLRKEIELKDDQFIIHYKLTNTGEKTIRTNEYAHNFLAIDNDLMGSNYSLHFLFDIKPKLFWGNVNPEEKVEIKEKYFTFDGTPEEQFFFGNVSGSREVKAYWELINTESKIGISETGSFKTSKVNIWGWKHVISPELFFEINLEKGKTLKWSRTYRIFEVE